MKKYLIYISLFLVIIGTGCANFLDVNHDPNNTPDSSVELVFPAGVEAVSSVFGGYWLILGEVWSQHWTSGSNAPQYQAEDSYSITAGDYSYDSNGWQYLYYGGLMDLEWVKLNARSNENWSYFLMAETMQCYTYHVLADFFENIPMTNALKGVPATFDNGEQVYDTLIARLDFALAQDLTAPTVEDPEDADIVFGGDMDNWKAFANTLKLKIFLRQRFARPEVAENGIRAMYNAGATFLTTDACMNSSHFEDFENKSSYVYELEFRSGNTNMKASRTVLDTLIALESEALSDPRLDYLFRPGSGGHLGMYQGDFRNIYSGANKRDTLSSPIVSPVQPVYYISLAESYFLQAEACMLGWGTGDAKSLYEFGIEAHFARLGTSGAADIYGVGGYAEYPNPGAISEEEKEENLEAIIFQKWISMVNTQGMESFFEHNRTGYPRESTIEPGNILYPIGAGSGEFIVSVTGVLAPPVKYPKRLIYPSSEQSTNPNTPAVISLNVPIWWDVRDYQSVYVPKTK